MSRAHLHYMDIPMWRERQRLALAPNIPQAYAACLPLQAGGVMTVWAVAEQSSHEVEEAFKRLIKALSGKSQFLGYISMKPDEAQQTVVLGVQSTLQADLCVAASLADMLKDPNLKRQAWGQLKVLKATLA